VPGHAQTGRSDSPPQGEHLIAVDSHERGSLPVLAGSQERKPHFGPVDEQIKGTISAEYSFGKPVKGEVTIPEKAAATGKKVAVVGSGPAGLTLATYTLFGLAFNRGWLELGTLPDPTTMSPVLIEGVGFAMNIVMVTGSLWFFGKA
jgi:hypothetical protein